jgi:hypothetical protein
MRLWGGFDERLRGTVKISTGVLGLERRAETERLPQRGNRWPTTRAACHSVSRRRLATTATTAHAREAATTEPDEPKGV